MKGQVSIGNLLDSKTQYIRLIFHFLEIHNLTNTNIQFLKDILYLVTTRERANFFNNPRKL